MLVKDKLILIFYICIKHLDINDIQVFINDLAKELKNELDDSIQYWIIPVYDETRIECINPVLLDEKQYQSVKEKIERLEQEFFKNLNKE
jgi:hypothetical protein